MVEGGGRAGELHTNTVGWQKRFLVGYASHGIEEETQRGSSFTCSFGGSTTRNVGFLVSGKVRNFSCGLQQFPHCRSTFERSRLAC